MQKCERGTFRRNSLDKFSSRFNKVFSWLQTFSFRSIQIQKAKILTWVQLYILYLLEPRDTLLACAGNFLRRHDDDTAASSSITSSWGIVISCLRSLFFSWCLPCLQKFHEKIHLWGSKQFFFKKYNWTLKFSQMERICAKWESRDQL